MICCFTGHRARKLPWGDDETDPRCLAVKTILKKRLDTAYEMGCRAFLCGMALGCDLYFAEAVLELKERDSTVTLAAMIPCPEQAGRWSAVNRLRYEGLLKKCDCCEILEPAYSKGCMLRRNEAMIDRSQVLISVFDGSPGGTMHAVAYAKKQGLTVLPVWV